MRSGAEMHEQEPAGYRGAAPRGRPEVFLGLGAPLQPFVYNRYQSRAVSDITLERIDWGKTSRNAEMSSSCMCG